jgi:hypothetical protein
MAEAKRRARQRRVFLALIALLFAAGAAVGAYFLGGLGPAGPTKASATSAGRGSEGKVLGPISVTGPTVTTVGSVETGALVRCDGSVGAKAPPPGHRVNGPINRSNPALSPQIELKRLRDRSLVISCEP